MPSNLVKKEAKNHHTSVAKQESIWNKAKAQAKKEKPSNLYAYATTIYENMIHAHNAIKKNK